MAVSVADVALAARIITDLTQTIPPGSASILERKMGVATLTVGDYAPNAPEVAKDEAIILMAAYLFDKPAVSTSGFVSAFFNSGAATLLSRWHVERSSVIRGDSEGEQRSTPGGGVDLDAVHELISSAISSHAGQPNVHHAPNTVESLIDAAISSHEGQPNIHHTPADVQELINAAISSHAAMVNAHHVPVGGGGGGGVLNVLAGNRLPAGPVKMRLGWSQSRVFVAGTFTRAETHPTDGAAEGFSSGLIVPPFPPALATDTSLYLGVWIAGTEELIAIDRSGVDSLSTFPVADKISIQVDGINGHYYPASAREAAPTTDNILSVVIPGDTVFTSANVSDWAKSNNTDLIPAAKLPAGGGLVEIISKTNLHVSRNNPANLAYLRSGWRDYKLLGLAISHQEFESFDFDIWRANTIGESVQMYWISPADIQDQATYTSGGSTESTAVLINLDPGMHIIGLNTSTDRIKFALNQIRIAEDNAGRLVLFGQQYAREVEHQDGGNILFGGTETKSNLGTIQVQLWGMN